MSSQPGLLDLAARIVAADGPDALTMDRLAQVAGVSRATLYRRVGSREALLARLANERGIDHAIGGDVRERILAASRAVFARQGLAAGTMEAVAAEAGVGVATVYRHFGDREGLLEAFAAAFAPTDIGRALTLEPFEGESGTRLLVDPVPDVRAALERVATSGLRFIHANRDLMLLSLSQDPDAQRLFAVLRRRRRVTTDQLADYLEAQMTAGRIRHGDPTTMAIAFVGMILMLAGIAPLHHKRELGNPEAVARDLVGWFLDGALPRGAIEEAADVEAMNEFEEDDGERP